MKSVKGYFDKKLEDPEYRTAYLALEEEYQKKHSRLLKKLRTQEMEQDLRFLDSSLVQNAEALGWITRFATLKRFLGMSGVGTTVPFAYQGGVDPSGASSTPYRIAATTVDPSDASSTPHRIAATTIETSYNANVPETP